MLAHPDFSEPFTTHMDASHCQLGGVASQDGKPLAFHIKKLTDTQTRRATTERDLLSIVETLKKHYNILLGHKIEVFADHKNLVCNHFDTERVVCWCLILKEFGPTLTHVKGEHNVVADALSWPDLKEEEFSPDAFAGDQDDSPEDFPFSHTTTAQAQPNNPELMDRWGSGELCNKTVCKHADKECEPITQTDTGTNQSEMVILKSSQKKTTSNR
jgi:hypothetical protein